VAAAAGQQQSWGHTAFTNLYTHNQKLGQKGFHWQSHLLLQRMVSKAAQTLHHNLISPTRISQHG
jgi:hypothetical protein